MNGIASTELGKNGLELVVDETKRFDKLIRKSYKQIGLEVYGTEQTPGVAVFTYGSPGRRELIGGDSDADIFLIETERTAQSQKFRDELKKKWETFGFSKVDLPSWGAYKEIEIYLDKSLVEGNQVLETRFLAGDEEVRQGVFQRKARFNSVERGLQNIVFNRLYLNQYFRQRFRNGVLNLKYCLGGSRDFLFISWYDHLDRMLKGDSEDPSYRPRIEIGLNRLRRQGRVTSKEVESLLEAIGFTMELRSDVLFSNKGTSDRGLTFLDEATLKKLHSLGYSAPEEVRSRFEEYRGRIQNLARIVWEETIQAAGSIRGKSWKEQFNLAYNPSTPEETRAKIPSDDPLLGTALIWGASESNQEGLLRKLAQKHRDSESWPIIGSMVCSPFCPPEILHHFGTGQLKEKGYGYLLRVVARNKNVTQETLESIAEDPSLEKRYTEIAKAALEGGTRAANNQI